MPISVSSGSDDSGWLSPVSQNPHRGLAVGDRNVDGAADPHRCVAAGFQRQGDVVWG